MWKQLAESIFHQYLRTTWSIRSTVARWYYFILFLIDPPPAHEPNETSIQYVQRIDRKHALRHIELELHILPPLDVEKLERALNTSKLPKQEREKLETFLAFGKHRQKFLILKQLLLQG